tara:strand:- start:289 stop:540 length:252 start_codon:yes stop_codon:yes gene_type:complete
MGNCIGKCCDCFADFWSTHGIPLHFISMFAIICSVGLCPWLAMIGFIPLSYLTAKIIKKLMKRHIKRRIERKRMEMFLRDQGY